MNGDRQKNIFPVQLTTSRIGNPTRLMHTLLYMITTHHTYILRNLVSAYECGRVFSAGVGPGSPSKYAANSLPLRFSLSVETRRRYGWLEMVFPGARLPLRNLVLGYECGRVFPAGVGPGSHSRDAANCLPSRFSLSVEMRRRYGWLGIMVFPGARLFRAPIWCPSGSVAAYERQGALSRRAW